MCILALITAAFSVQPMHACLMLTSTTKDGTVLVGNNEDWKDPVEHLFFVPPSSGQYGYILYGRERIWPQSGINDQGLVFDYFATPYRAKRRTGRVSRL